MNRDNAGKITSEVNGAGDTSAATRKEPNATTMGINIHKVVLSAYITLNLIQNYE